MCVDYRRECAKGVSTVLVPIVGIIIGQSFKINHTYCIVIYLYRYIEY